MREDWGWAIGNYPLLAHYVVPSVFAGTALVPPDIHKLRNDLPRAVEELYSRLSERDLHYDNEMYGIGAGTQNIREPYVVLGGGRGTCLDLALLFAGMCLEARLRPFVGVFKRGDSGTPHALVVVSAAAHNAPGLEAWGGLAADDGVLAPSWEQLRDRLRGPHGWVAVEITGAVTWEWPERRLSFEQAREVAHAVLTTVSQNVVEADQRIRLVDVAYLHPTYRPRRGNRLERVPPSLEPRIRHRYEEVLAAVAKLVGSPQPARWDLDELNLLHDRFEQRHPGETTVSARFPHARDTLTAIRDALEAKRVLASVGGDGIGFDRLQHLYRHQVGAWPEGGTLDALLVEAASAAIAELRRPPVETLGALARFVLGLAHANGLSSPDHPELSSWLAALGHAPGDATTHLRKRCKRAHWMIVDLGDESRTGELQWPSRISAVLVDADNRLSSDSETCAPSRQGLAEGLRKLFGRVPSGQKLLVDLAAPRALLDQDIEHWPLVHLYDDDYDALSDHFQPRFRWSMRRRNERLHDLLEERTSEVEWVEPPATVPAEVVDDERRLKMWLREHPHPPYLLDGPANGATADPLRVMLKQGYGFVVWYPAGMGAASVQHATRAARKLPPLARRHALPAEFSDQTEDRTVIIWDDPHGREGFALPERPALQNSGGAR
jgi:hypothetical protein